MEKVSVVIVTYNRSFDILDRAIKSVLNQTYSCFELIVVNDTPKKSPLYVEVSEKITKYGDRIRYFAEGVNHGACFARNYGAKYAQGKYIAFLDDDDEWINTKLSKQIEQMGKTNSVMVTCQQNTIIVGNNKSLFETIKYDMKYFNKKINLQMILNSNVVGGCSRPLILKEAFDKVGGFDEKMPASQDSDLWIRLATIGKISSTKDKLLNYYIHKTDQISYNPKNRIKANKLLIDKHKHLAINEDKFLKIKYLVIAYSYYLLSDYNSGDEYFRLSKTKKGFSLSMFIRTIRIVKLRNRNLKK